MNKFFLGSLCATLLCSCGFFERKPLDEEQIRDYIFPKDDPIEKKIDAYSRGAVGGRSFVVRLEVISDDMVLEQLGEFQLLYSYAEDDPNRVLIIEMFHSSVLQHFSDSTKPTWIPEETTCQKGVSLYRKQNEDLVIYAYQGVGNCNELFFFGTLD